MTKQRFITLVDKYLSGGATASERRLVDDVLDDLQADGGNVLDEERGQSIKNAMWLNIQQATQQPRYEAVTMHWHRQPWFRTVAVAASVVLAVGLATLLFYSRGNDKQLATGAKPNDKPIVVYHDVVNNSGSDTTLQVSDGSLIKLSANSEITYIEPFAVKRDFKLVGKAFFKVAKDNTKPFTVFSGDISTMALGTQFTVTAYKTSQQITVKLHEGKVVVRSLLAHNKKMKHDVYLLAGQSFVYNPQAAKTKNIAKANSEENLHDNYARDNPGLPTSSGSWYMFNNQSLSQVLDQLAFMHNVSILYNKRDLRSKYFVGKFNKSDSLETVLKYIAIANRLKLTRNDSTYIITKQSQK